VRRRNIRCSGSTRESKTSGCQRFEGKIGGNDGLMTDVDLKAPKAEHKTSLSSNLGLTECCHPAEGSNLIIFEHKKGWGARGRTMKGGGHIKPWKRRIQKLSVKIGEKLLSPRKKALRNIRLKRGGKRSRKENRATQTEKTLEREEKSQTRGRRRITQKQRDFLSNS